MEHLFLIGTPGCGRTLYARSLVNSPAAIKHTVACEGGIVSVYRAAGLEAPKPLVVPFRAPHHTVSEVGMTGMLRNGYSVRPGELSLAHGGLLLLDEAAEFRTAVLEHVLQTLRTGEVELYGTRGTRVILPAQFRLVVSTHSCPCGYFGSRARGVQCQCTEEGRKQYLGRLDAFREHCRVLEEPEIREKAAELKAEIS
jgi:magnesium chelatase family protein